MARRIGSPGAGGSTVGVLAHCGKAAPMTAATIVP
jgi:hypothetical protein